MTSNSVRSVIQPWSSMRRASGSCHAAVKGDAAEWRSQFKSVQHRPPGTTPTPESRGWTPAPPLHQSRRFQKRSPPSAPLWAAPNNKKCLNPTYDLCFPPFFLPRPEKIPHFENKIVQKTKMTQSWSSVSCTAPQPEEVWQFVLGEGVMLQRFFGEEKRKKKGWILFLEV